MLTVDVEPELILETEARVRRALDPHICSIWLRTKSNDLREGYQLSATASFGSEHVPIQIDDEVVEFKFEIYKAEIVLDPAKCRFATEFEVDLEKLQKVPADLTCHARESETRALVGSGKMLEALGGPKVEVEHKVSNTASEHQAWYEIGMINEHTMQISSKGPKAVPLNGTVLDDFIGWQVFPQTGQDSGVLARVRVRENWIRLVDPISGGKGVEWLNKFKGMFKKDSEDSVERREAFHMLLTHLVAQGLQDASDMRDATLAADTIIVRPRENAMSRVDGPEMMKPLALSGTAIGDFLAAPVGGERRVLIEKGVNPELLEGLGIHDVKEQDNQEHSGITETFKAEIHEILDRYFTQMKPLNSLIKLHGAMRVQATVIDAIKPKSYDNGFGTRRIPINAQHHVNIIMRRRHFEDFVTNGNAWQFKYLSEHKAMRNWLDTEIDNGRGHYNIKIGEYISMKFGERQYMSYFNETKDSWQEYIAQLD